MSTLRNAIILLGLGLSASARADHVDWSQYIEAPGTAKAPMAKHAEAPIVTAAKQQQAKPAKVAAKQPAAKPAAKAKKPAARKAHR